MTEETRRLYRWLQSLAAELEMSEQVPIDEEMVHILLDLARDAAHTVARPAAPLTTFLAGVAVGRGADLESVAAQATGLIQQRGDGSASPEGDA